jgi:hypothetical protein
MITVEMTIQQPGQMRSKSVGLLLEERDRRDDAQHVASVWRMRCAGATGTPSMVTSRSLRL